MTELLAKCGFCSGSGSVSWNQKAPYPPGTHGHDMGFNRPGKSKDAPPYIEARITDCPVCHGATQVKAPLDANGRDHVLCPKCRGKGRESQQEGGLGLPGRCRACKGTGWAGGEPVP